MSRHIGVFHIQHLRSKAQKSKQDFGKKRPARLSRKLKASRPVRKKKKKTTKCHWNKLKKIAAALFRIHLDSENDYLQNNSSFPTKRQLLFHNKNKELTRHM